MRILPANSQDELELAKTVSSNDAEWYLERRAMAFGLVASVVRRVRTPEGVEKYGQPIGSIIYNKSIWNDQLGVSGNILGYSLVDKESDHTVVIQNSSANVDSKKSFKTYVVYNHATGDIVGSGKSMSWDSAKKNAVKVLNKHLEKDKKLVPKAVIKTASTKEEKPFEVKKGQKFTTQTGEKVSAVSDVDPWNAVAIEDEAGEKIYVHEKDIQKYLKDGEWTHVDEQEPAVDANAPTYRVGQKYYSKSDGNQIEIVGISNSLVETKVSNNVGSVSLSFPEASFADLISSGKLTEISETSKDEVDEFQMFLGQIEDADEQGVWIDDAVSSIIDWIVEDGSSQKSAAILAEVLEDNPKYKSEVSADVLSKINKVAQQDDDSDDSGVKTQKIVEHSTEPQSNASAAELEKQPGTAQPGTAPAETSYTPFVKGKQVILGELVKKTKKGDAHHNVPKKSLADGVTPEVGMKVISMLGDKDGVIVETLQAYSRVKHEDGSKSSVANSKLNAAGALANVKPAGEGESAHFADPSIVWNHADVYAEEHIDVQELDAYGNSSLLPMGHPKYKSSAGGVNSNKQVLKVAEDQITDVKQWFPAINYGLAGAPYEPNDLLPGGKVRVNDDFNEMYGEYVLKSLKKLPVKSKTGKDIDISVAEVIDSDGTVRNVRMANIKSYAPPKSFYSVEDEEATTAGMPEATLTQKIDTMTKLRDSMTAQEKTLFDQISKSVADSKNAHRFPKLSKTIFNTTWPLLSSNKMHNSTFSVSESKSKKAIIERMKKANPNISDGTVEEMFYNLRWYTSSGYAINKDLRRGKDLSDTQSKLVRDIDAILDQSETDQNMVVYRLSKLDPENFLPGDVMEDLGFLSTTVLSDSKKFEGTAGISSEEGTTFEILVPKGTKGAYLGDFSSVKSEKEFLIARGYRYKVLYNNNRHIVFQLVPKDTI